MTDFVRDTIKYGFILLVTGLAAGISLAPIYKMTKPIISKLEADKNTIALKELFPDGKKFEKWQLSYDKVTTVKDDKDIIIGFTFKISAKGYGGFINILAGIDEQGYLKGIRVLSHTETPGLGAKIVEVKKDKSIWDVFSNTKTEEKENQIPWFQKQFEGKLINALILVKRTPLEMEDSIQAITGATITSRAIVQSIKKMGERIIADLNKKKLDEQNMEIDEWQKKWPSSDVNISEASDVF